MRSAARMTWSSALSNLALFVTALGLAIHVRAGLGHWPKPMWEDYRTLGFEVHALALLGIGLFAVYAAVPVWALCVCLPRFRVSARTHLIQAALYLLGWGLVAGFIVLDPYQFVTWLKD